MRYILQLYIINKNENSINWDTINVKLDFNNDNENNPDNIKYLGYINQKKSNICQQIPWCIYRSSIKL